MSDMPLERTITDGIMAWLKTLAPDGWFIKVHGGVFQAAGIPDIIGVYKGRFVALEVKRPKVGRLSALQAIVLRKMTAARALARVVCSLDEAKAVIKEAGLRER